MTMHRRSNMSVDNLARGQRTMLSTAEPGTPARGERMSQGEPTPQGQQPIKPHGVHLNPAVRLSKRWGPPLSADQDESFGHVQLLLTALCLSRHARDA